MHCRHSKTKACLPGCGLAKEAGPHRRLDQVSPGAARIKKTPMQKTLWSRTLRNIAASTVPGSYRLPGRVAAKFAGKSAPHSFRPHSGRPIGSKAGPKEPVETAPAHFSRQARRRVQTDLLHLENRAPQNQPASSHLALCRFGLCGRCLEACRPSIRKAAGEIPDTLL